MLDECHPTIAPGLEQEIELTRWKPIEPFGGWFPGGTVDRAISNRSGDGSTTYRSRAFPS